MSETYDVYFGTAPDALELLASGVSATQLAVTGPYDYDTTYYWRVDAVNEFGTTTGDVWSFTTLAWDPPIATWRNLPGKTLGPLDGGVAGMDFYYTGENFIAAVRQLVAAANDAIWYEAIDS